ncbi:7178_t:CDS:1, partial [Racocetra fulgida]
SQGFLDKKIIEELCELHKKEMSKGSYDSEFINSIEEYLERNQLKSKDLINL